MLGVNGVYFKLSDVDLIDRPLGQVTPRDLIRGVQTWALKIRLRADVTFGGVGSTDGTVANGGLLRALLRRIMISEAGDRTTNVEGRVAGVFGNQIFAPKEQEEIRPLLDSDDIEDGANIILEDYVTVYFAVPALGSPYETAFLERDPNVSLEVEFETVTNAYATLVNGGDRGMTVNAFSAEILQYHDRSSQTLPFFVPQYRLIANRPISTEVEDLEIELKANGFIGAIVVQQSTATYEVDDIIERLELRGSTNRYSEGRISAALLRQMHEDQFGGRIRPGYIVYNFLTSGRLGGIHNPFRNPDLRLIVDADESSVESGTGSAIKVWALEFVQDPRVTRALPEALAAG